MSKSETQLNDSVRSNCPQCEARLAVLRVIPGRAGCEYWTLRCTRCGGIHLDIIRAAAGAFSTEQQPA
jgi:uncharacterized Zn finger protein